MQVTDTVRELIECIDKVCIPMYNELILSGSLSSDTAKALANGLGTYIKTGHTPHQSYLAARHAYHASRGRLPLYIKAIYNRLFPIDVNISRDSPEFHIAERIAETGYAILDGYFAGHKSIQQAQQFLNTKFPDTVPVSNQLKLSIEDDEALNLDIYKIIAKDHLLNTVAQLYLGSPPLIDIVTAWRLLPPKEYRDEDLSSNALMYHIDLDRFNFLKLFVYLSDVDEGSGPHRYVPKTHLVNLPTEVKEDRRYSDLEISELGLNSLNIIGKYGTVILADTHCLHKGSVPIEKHRDIFQVEYCLSLFGAPYPRYVNKANNSPLRDTLEHRQ